MFKKRLTPKVILKEVLVLALIFLISYIGNQHVQSWLGQRAVNNTGFEHVSFEEALTKAQAEDKNLLIDFAAIWCPACRKLDNQVISQTEVKAEIEKNYVFTRLEYESDDREIFERYGIQGFPTLLVVDQTGKPLRRIATTLDPEQFIEQL